MSKKGLLGLGLASLAAGAAFVFKSLKSKNAEVDDFTDDFADDYFEEEPVTTEEVAE